MERDDFVLITGGDIFRLSLMTTMHSEAFHMRHSGLDTIRAVIED